MTTTKVYTVDAIFDGRVLRPVERLPFEANERVTLRIDISTPAPPMWPADTDEIYAELADDDRALANTLFDGVKATWPRADGA